MSIELVGACIITNSILNCLGKYYYGNLPGNFCNLIHQTFSCSDLSQLLLIFSSRQDKARVGHKNTSWKCLFSTYAVYWIDD